MSYKKIFFINYIISQMCKYFCEKNYIDQFLIPPVSPFSQKKK